MGLLDCSWVLVVINLVECEVKVFCKCLLKRDSESIVFIDKIIVSKIIVSLLWWVLWWKRCYVRFEVVFI